MVAAIFVAISWALTEFAKAHTVLVDMIYPYITRMVVSAFADWTGGLSFCLWQVFLVGLVAAGIVTIALMIVFFCDVVYSQIHPHTGKGITDMGANTVTAVIPQPDGPQLKPQLRI